MEEEDSLHVTGQALEVLRGLKSPFSNWEFFESYSAHFGSKPPHAELGFTNLCDFIESFPEVQLVRSPGLYSFKEKEKPAEETSILAKPEDGKESEGRTNLSSQQLIEHSDDESTIHSRTTDDDDRNGSRCPSEASEDDGESDQGNGVMTGEERLNDEEKKIVEYSDDESTILSRSTDEDDRNGSRRVSVTIPRRPWTSEDAGKTESTSVTPLDMPKEEEGQKDPTATVLREISSPTILPSFEEFKTRALTIAADLPPFFHLDRFSSAYCVKYCVSAAPFKELSFSTLFECLQRIPEIGRRLNMTADNIEKSQKSTESSPRGLLELATEETEGEEPIPLAGTTEVDEYSTVSEKPVISNRNREELTEKEEDEPLLPEAKEGTEKASSSPLVHLEKSDEEQDEEKGETVRMVDPNESLPISDKPVVRSRSREASTSTDNKKDEPQNLEAKEGTERSPSSSLRETSDEEPDEEEENIEYARAGNSDDEEELRAQAQVPLVPPARVQAQVPHVHAAGYVRPVKTAYLQQMKFPVVKTVLFHTLMRRAYKNAGGPISIKYKDKNRGVQRVWVVDRASIDGIKAAEKLSPGAEFVLMVTSSETGEQDVCSLSELLQETCSVDFIRWDSLDHKSMIDQAFIRSCSLLLASVVQLVVPRLLTRPGPSEENGLYFSVIIETEVVHGIPPAVSLPRLNRLLDNAVDRQFKFDTVLLPLHLAQDMGFDDKKRLSRCRNYSCVVDGPTIPSAGLISRISVLSIIMRGDGVHICAVAVSTSSPVSDAQWNDKCAEAASQFGRA